MKKIFFVAVILFLGITVSLWGLDHLTDRKQTDAGIDGTRYYVIAVLRLGNKEAYYTNSAKQDKQDTVLDNYWYLTDSGWALSGEKLTLSHLKYSQISVNRRD